jgi:hypothetical protein
MMLNSTGGECLHINTPTTAATTGIYDPSLLWALYGGRGWGDCNRDDRDHSRITRDILDSSIGLTKTIGDAESHLQDRVSDSERAILNRVEDTHDNLIQDTCDIKATVSAAAHDLNDHMSDRISRVEDKISDFRHSFDMQCCEVNNKLDRNQASTLLEFERTRNVILLDAERNFNKTNRNIDDLRCELEKNKLIEQRDDARNQLAEFKTNVINDKLDTIIRCSCECPGLPTLTTKKVS